jgi:glycosyltransferase domain-containing protein
MSDLTILLTLKGRKKFTKRWLDWMSIEKCPYKILLADGDEDKSFTKDLISDIKYSSLNIEHIKYPYDKDVYTFIKKLSDVSKKISTKYVVHTDNDDFILINNLENAVKYYEKNQQIGTLALPHYRFKIHDSDEDKLYPKKGSKISFQRLVRLNNKNLLSKNQSIRLKEAVKIFPSDFIWYGIHKSQDFRKLNNDLLKIVIDDLIFQEWYATYMFPMLGTIECPSELDPFIVRQEETSSIAKDQLKLSEFIMRPNWSRQLETMRESLSNLYSEKDQKGKVIIKEKFNQSFLEMMKMVNVAAKIGSYLNRYRTLYLVCGKIYAILRGKGRTDLSHREVKKDIYLNKLTQFLKRKT